MGLARPTTDDLIGWLKLQTAPSPEALVVYDECMDAALDDLESRLSQTFVVGDGFSLLQADANYPPRVHAAVLIAAARLAKRSTTPGGVEGIDQFGIALRILGTDVDVEALIRRYKRMDGFS